MREILIFFGVAVFYKVSRFIAIGDVQTAFANAYKVVRFEQLHGLFHEIFFQKIFLDKTTLIRVLNRFYLMVHVPSIIAFFFWLFRYHRKNYYFIRNGFLFANFITLFIFMWYPCAPPRMLANLGFKDTLLQVSNLNLYSSQLTHFFNQYAAMPSMHFGTALIISVAAIALSKTAWIKVLMFFYAPFVLFVIVVTGNHFFMDAIMGAAISVIGYVCVYVFYKIFLSKKMFPIIEEPIVTAEQKVPVVD